MAETVSPQPRAVDETPEKPSYASISNPSTYTQKSDGKLPLKLKPVIYVHGEPTVSFNFLDLESYIQEENLQYALVAKFSYGRPDMIDLRKSFTRHFAIKGDCNLGLLDHRHVLVRLSNQEDFVEVYSRAVSFITIKEKGVNNQYQCRIQRWTPWFNPKEETSIALAWISFPSLSTQMFAREALFSLASAVGTPLQVDKATTGKLRPSVARVKVEVNLLSSLPDRVRMFFKDEKNGVVKEVLQKIVYDKLPSYCTKCKHQGHKEEECRLTMEVEGGLIDETKINGAKFEGDLRSILDEKKKVLSLQQTGKEVTLPTSSNSEKNSMERVDETGPLLVAATSGNKEDTETMLPGTLTSKISEQLGTTTTSSSTPVHIDVEAQNNVDNNSRQLIVTSQFAAEQLSSRLVKDSELDSPNAVVVTKSRQDEAKKGNTTAEKFSNQWTLVSHKKTAGSKSSNNHILHQKNSTHVEFDRSNNVVECTQFDVLRDEKFGQYEGLHVTGELSAESGNTLDLDKQIEQTGKLKQCCHDEHTNQQALVTHEKEFIVTEKIDGKEINPNTPTMFILDQEVATNNLNESKEKQGVGSASRWADLVEEENHTPSPSRSKLSPQALEFVPTSKTNPSMAVIGTSSNLSATKVNVADRDILYDLGNDMSDGNDEYHEDDEEEMLDICFDKVAKEGDLSPRQQRSGSTKCKKKTHGRQHSWDGKVSEDFVPRHLPMRLAKQNHMTVSTTLSRSNKSKK